MAREQRLSRLIGTAARGLALAAALLCFLASAMLSPHPQLPAPAAPDSGSVRLAAAAGGRLFEVARAAGEARSVGIGFDELAALTRLLHHGLPWIRASWSYGDDWLTMDGSARVASRSWLNFTVRAREAKDGGPPQIAMRAGNVPLPAEIVVRAAGVLLKLRSGDELPPLSGLLQSMRVGPGSVEATVALPPALLKLNDLFKGEREAIDPAVVRAVYGRLLAEQARRPDTSLAGQLRRAVQATAGLAPQTAANRAALVGLAMFAVDPAAGELARAPLGELPARPEGLPLLELAGRTDLPKHFTLSAAMSAALDDRLTRAVGEWKELDDSLPGGSGFSFVDLAADRAGLLLGRALADPETTARTAAMIRTAREEDIFPAEALGLREGLSAQRFRCRFGGIETSGYHAEVARVDRLLREVPLYGWLLAHEPVK